MGHNEHGSALFCQIPDDRKDISHKFRIQGGGGLIKQEHFRINGQGPCNGDPLLLPPGKLRRIGALPVGQPNLFPAVPVPFQRPVF